MKVLFILLLAIAFAADIKRAGTTTSSTSFGYPLWTSGACAAQTTQKSYVSFPVTLTTDTTYHVYGHSEQGLLSTLRVVVYNTFDPLLPCANVRERFEAAGKRPCINDMITLPAGTYTVVVFSSGNAGTFSLQLLETVANGTTLASPYTWYVPSASDGACSVTSTKTLVGTYTWTQATQGDFDIVVLLKNTTLGSQNMHVVLLNGTNPMNASEINNPCTMPSYNSKDFISTSTSPVEVFLAATLAAGQTYTVAFSYGGLWAVGDYAVRIRPTELAWMPAEPKNFNVPANSPPCNPTGTMKMYSTYYFTAEYNVYIMDQGNQRTYTDLTGFLYEGKNTGSWTQGPSSCDGYIMGGDLGDVTVLFKLGVVPGREYTAIFSTYGMPTGNFTFRRLLFTGLKIGDVPEIPPAPATPTFIHRNCSTGELRWVQATGSPVPTDYKVEYTLKTGTTFGAWTVVTPSWNSQKANATDFRLIHYGISCPSTLKYRLSAMNTVGYSLPSAETAEITPTSSAGRVVVSFALLALLLFFF